MITEYKSRGEMMAALVAPGGVGAEIGVLVGQFSAELLGICQPKRLHLVDPWEPSDCDTAWGDHLTRVEDRLSASIARGIVHLHRTTGRSWLESQPEGSLDWVYIDSSHTYQDTADEIFAAWRAVRPGGIIAGHDLVIEFGAYWGSGVVRAVIDAAQRGRMRVEGLTCERWPSWAARRTG